MPVDIDDFCQWVASKDGQLSEEAIDAVGTFLKRASVHAEKRKIILSNGDRLSIKEVAQRLHKRSSLPLPIILSHVVGWLQMHYEPKGLSDSEMEAFENLIGDWTDPYD